MERGEPGRGELLRPRADTAEMPGVPDRDYGEAVGLRPLRGERHRLEADHLAVAEIAVDQQHRTPVGDDGGVAVGEDLPGLHPVDILVDAHHAVGIVPGEIGFDEMGGDDARLFGVGARGPEDGLDIVLQPVPRHADAGACLLVSLCQPEILFFRWASRRAVSAIIARAKSIASTMLCADAIPLPAMSKAVP